MLRITVRDQALEERWILQGRLTQRSVGELVSTWNASLCPKQRRVVDLDEVTSIDKSGEEALWMMICDGATIVAGGLYTKHLVEDLKARKRNPPGPGD